MTQRCAAGASGIRAVFVDKGEVVRGPLLCRTVPSAPTNTQLLRPRAPASGAELVTRLPAPQVSWYTDLMLDQFTPGSVASHDELSDYIHQLLGSTADWMSPSDSLQQPAAPAYTQPSGTMRSGAAAAGRTSGATATRPPRGGGSPAPQSQPPMSPAVGVLHRLRRSHTFTGKAMAEGMPLAAPAEMAPSDWAPTGAAQQQRPLKRRSVDDLSALDAETEPRPTVPHVGPVAQPRGAQLRRSSSLPGPPAGGQAACHRQGTAMQAVGGIDSEYYSGARTPLWAAKRQAGAPPLLDARGVPTWPMPPDPPAATQASSPYVGVSRAPWSTRWDAHAVTATGESVYCGSFDSEERAARAHDVAQLKLMGTTAGSGFCNFGVHEYPGIHELADMPLADFLAALSASAVDPLERRYSKYRGVYRDRNQVKGGAERWESRLEEAPDGVNAASSGGDGASTGGMRSIM
jgi:hypothetical protein